MRRVEARWSKIANFQSFSEHMFDRTQRHDKIPDANHKVWSNLWETCVIVTSRRRGGFRISWCDFFFTMCLAQGWLHVKRVQGYPEIPIVYPFLGNATKPSPAELRSFPVRSQGFDRQRAGHGICVGFGQQLPSPWRAGRLGPSVEAGRGTTGGGRAAPGTGAQCWMRRS